jgi:hypothetical protein
MSKTDIDNKLSAIKEAYKLESGGNELFDENGLINITYLGSEMTKITNIEEPGVKEKFTDVNLFNRYAALYVYQERILENSLLYYMYMSEEFYSRLDLLAVNAEDLNEIHKGLEQLEDSFKEFKVAKNKLEQTVDVLTFEGVVRADLTSYSYSVNTLIEDCIEFTNNFIKIAEKYLYSGEINESNVQLYTKHYLFEACHRVNEVVYYKSFKAYNNVNECDLAKWDTKGAVLMEGALEGLVEKALETTTKAFAASVDEVLGFKEVRDSFVQKLGVYKVVYDSMDYYRYNQYLAAGEENKYKENAGSVERANIELVNQFYQTTLAGYYGDAFWGQIDISN